MNTQQLIQKLTKLNPNIAKNERAQQYLTTVINNDSQKGEEIANNLLQTYGKSKEEALAEARRFFGM